jgi:hypothetical protein
LAGWRGANALPLCYARVLREVLAIDVAAATGMRVVIFQYAAISEAKSLVAEMNQVDKPSALAK